MNMLSALMGMPLMRWDCSRVRFGCVVVRFDNFCKVVKSGLLPFGGLRMSFDGLRMTAFITSSFSCLNTEQVMYMSRPPGFRWRDTFVRMDVCRVVNFSRFSGLKK